MAVFLHLLAEVPVAIVTTLLAARLLGARRSWVNVVMAGLTGWIIGTLIHVGVRGFNWDRSGPTIDTIVLSIVFTMLVAIGLDLLARPGSLARGEQAGLVVFSHPLRDLKRRVAPYARYREIVAIARRNGLGRISASRLRDVDATPTGIAIRRTLEEGGVVFVKLGQMASTRADLVPEAIRRQLDQLRDHVEPSPTDAMREQVENELGRSVDDVFGSFDWEPVAAASVGQVYAATLRSGEAVIVKVRRPGIEEIVARDTAALRHLASLAQRRTPIGQQLRVAEMADEFVRSLERELDFREEAAAASDMSAHTPQSACVHIPRIYHELSSRRVLVMERLNGGSIADHDRLESLELDRNALADRFVRVMVDHMFGDGHFHADPHPGNVLLLDDGSLGLIDFGSTARLSATQRAGLIDIAVAVVNADSAALREAVERVAIVGPDSDGAVLERALGRYMADNVRPGVPIDARALHDLVPLLAAFDIRLPGELSMFLRALMLVEGTARMISPGYDLFEGLRATIGDTTAGPQPEGSMQDRLLHELMQELPRLRHLPSHLERTLSLAARGELRTRVSLLSTRSDVAAVSAIVNRLALALLGGTLAIASALLLSIPAGAQRDANTSLTRVLGFVGLATAAVLVLRVVAGIVRDGNA